MTRGEVWWINFDPSLGGEIQKTRPAVIVSNDASNRYLNRLQVVPITRKVERLYPSETYVNVNGERRKAMADQIATVSKQRLKERLGRLTVDDMRLVERAMLVQLDRWTALMSRPWSIDNVFSNHDSFRSFLKCPSLSTGRYASRSGAATARWAR